MTVRLAEHGDVSEILRMTIEFLDSQNIVHLRPRIVSMVIQHLRTPGYFSFVAELEGKLVGLFLGFLDEVIYSGELVVRDRFMYVRPNGRTWEIAQGLLNAACHWGYEAGCSKAVWFLTGVAKHEQLTRVMTERLGYGVVGSVVEKQL